MHSFTCEKEKFSLENNDDNIHILHTFYKAIDFFFIVPGVGKGKVVVNHVNPQEIHLVVILQYNKDVRILV